MIEFRPAHKPSLPLPPAYVYVKGRHDSEAQNLNPKRFENTVKGIEDLALAIWHNHWDRRIYVGAEPVAIDDLAIRVRMMLAQSLGYAPGLQSVREAIYTIASAYSRNPISEFLEALQWDSIDRTDALLRALGMAPTSLNAAKAWLLIEGIVGRALEPGIGYPYIPVLVSEKQGRGKGALLQLLAVGGYASGATPGWDWQKTIGEKMAGLSVLEISELTKAVMDIFMRGFRDLATNPKLVYRGAYKSVAEPQYLQGIIVATTNERYPLTSHENRRHFVLEHQHDIALDWVKATRHQLWAQAKDRLSDPFRRDDSGDIALPRDMWGAAIEESELYTDTPAYRDALREALRHMTSIRGHELALVIEGEGMREITNKILGQEMQRLGFQKGRDRHGNYWRRDKADGCEVCGGDGSDDCDCNITDF